MKRGIASNHFSSGSQRLRSTQAIARELRLHADADAILYPSRYGAPSTCYALFESTGDLPLIEPTAPPAGVDLKSEALSEAMVLHGLRWEE